MSEETQKKDEIAPNSVQDEKIVDDSLALDDDFEDEEEENDEEDLIPPEKPDIITEPGPPRTPPPKEKKIAQPVSVKKADTEAVQFIPDTKEKPKRVSKQKSVKELFTEEVLADPQATRQVLLDLFSSNKVKPVDLVSINLEPQIVQDAWREYLERKKSLEVLQAEVDERRKPFRIRTSRWDPTTKRMIYFQSEQTFDHYPSEDEVREWASQHNFGNGVYSIIDRFRKVIGEYNLTDLGVIATVQQPQEMIPEPMQMSGVRPYYTGAMVNPPQYLNYNYGYYQRNPQQPVQDDRVSVAVERYMHNENEMMEVYLTIAKALAERGDMRGAERILDKYRKFAGLDDGNSGSSGAQSVAEMVQQTAELIESLKSASEVLGLNKNKDSEAESLKEYSRVVSEAVSGLFGAIRGGGGGNVSSSPDVTLGQIQVQQRSRIPRTRTVKSEQQVPKKEVKEEKKDAGGDTIPKPSGVVPEMDNAELIANIEAVIQYIEPSIREYTNAKRNNDENALKIYNPELIAKQHMNIPFVKMYLNMNKGVKQRLLEVCNKGIENVLRELEPTYVELSKDYLTESDKYLQDREKYYAGLPDDIDKDAFIKDLEKFIKIRHIWELFNQPEAVEFMNKYLAVVKSELS